MALRRALSKRLFNKNGDSSSTPLTLDHYSPNPFPNSAKTINFHLTSQENHTAEAGFFRRFLQRRRINQSTSQPPPLFLSLPVGEKLRETLRSINVAGDRLRFDGLTPPSPSPATGVTVSLKDVKRVLLFSKLEKLRSAIRAIPANSISRGEFVRICCEFCENREEEGLEFARMLDEEGNVIVLGDVVFLRPEQLAKSMDQIIFQSIAVPNDPRRKELEQLEKRKAQIDRKAQDLVRAELYCGLGFIILQTLGFMRLTFWELSWDVMEPICFFVTSAHFALAYGFFLKTSKEPSFESYFQRRFKVKQEKLMKIHKFDVEKYNELCSAFYPNYANFTKNRGSPDLRLF